MAITLRDIPRAFQLPRPDWATIRQWVETHVSREAQSNAWSEIASDWVRGLTEALGDGYRVDRSPRVLLLSSLKESDARILLRCAESGLGGIVDALGDLACEEWLGPLVILHFDSDGAYDRYTTPWDHELPPVPSAGICYYGYVHIALRPYPMEELQRTLLHELTHACLSHVQLPLWLEEGITQMAQEAAQPQWRQFSLSAEEASEIRAYWRDAGLGDFWWGTGFHRHDEGQFCSYRLAEVLFRLIQGDHRRELPAFVRHAHRDDAGEGAARRYLGIGLAEIARQFLGDGAWSPDPVDAAGYFRRGALAVSRGDHDAAIRDFDTAIELDERLADAYVQRALLHDKCGRTATAIGDCQRAIAIDPANYVAQNALAWILTTTNDDRIRNGERAVKHATIACERSGYVVWECVDTLAAAYAESGDFEEAERWAKVALELAPESEEKGCAERLQHYLRRQRLPE